MEPPPPVSELQPTQPATAATSLAGRLFNVIAAPGEVFDEIKSAPASTANWLVPVAIYILLGVISAFVLSAQPAIRQMTRDQEAKAMDKLVQQGKMTQAQEDEASQTMDKLLTPGVLAALGSAGVIIGAFVSVLAWALVLWLFGQWLFKARVAYPKMLEVAGLSLVIVVLGLVLGTLLGVILGRPNTGLSLALLVSDFDPTNGVHMLLNAVNAISIWHVAVLAAGLARLAGTRMARAFAAVFGFWVVLELLLIAISLARQWL
jgi:hypothetical protein